MAFEDTNKISGLVETNPQSTDPVSKGDDHLRMIKKVLKRSFPSDVDVQIPNISDAESGNYLTISEDGTAIEWSEFPDIESLISRPGEFQRSRFERADENTLRINPGSYHVSGKGYVNIDSAQEITVTDGGWNYIYIDSSKISPTTTTTRLSIASDAIYASVTAPVYSTGITKRSWYNGEDRCIFMVHVDSGVIRDFSQNHEFVLFMESVLDVERETSSRNIWVAHDVTIPPLDSMHGQFTFQAHAPGLTGIVGSVFRMRHNDGNGQPLGQVEGGESDRDEDHNIVSVRQMIYKGEEKSKVEIIRNVGATTAHNNYYSLSTTGFYLPDGM